MIQDTENFDLLDTLEKHSHEKEEGSANLSYASISRNSLGRAKDEAPIKGENRTAFARDRDRILYSKAFFRLAGKTQVFMSPRNPLISNRMTHTIHVAQLSRAIARSLNLNEDLAEAIALGHDTGHPPFGHRGEKILDEICQEYIGTRFEHNVHSLRMVDILEKGGAGINLTYEVREGIIRHCGESDSGVLVPGDIDVDLNPYNDTTAEPSTLEGCVVKICDRIAYVGKDIEDAVSSGIIREEDIPSRITNILGTNNGQMIDTLVKDLIMNFYKDRDESVERTGEQPSRKDLSIRLSKPVIVALVALIKDFNYPNIYQSDISTRYSKQTSTMMKGLFMGFLEELDEMALLDTGQSNLTQFADMGEHDVQSEVNGRTLGELGANEDNYNEYHIKIARKLIIQENIRAHGGQRSSVLYFLEQMSNEYRLNTENAQIAIDYITMMTDDMATSIYESLTIPRSIV